MAEPRHSSSSNSSKNLKPRQLNQPGSVMMQQPTTSSYFSTSSHLRKHLNHILNDILSSLFIPLLYFQKSQYHVKGKLYPCKESWSWLTQTQSSSMRWQFPCRPFQVISKWAYSITEKWHDFCPSLIWWSHSHSRNSNFICSLNGDTNTILERSINLILENPEACNLYPRPNIPPLFTTVFLANNWIVQGAILSFPLPVSFIYALWLHPAQHSSAVHVWMPCPGRDMYLILSKAHPPHLLTCLASDPKFQGLKPWSHNPHPTESSQANQFEQLATGKSCIWCLHCHVLHPELSFKVLLPVRILAAHKKSTKRLSLDPGRGEQDFLKQECRGKHVNLYMPAWAKVSPPWLRLLSLWQCCSKLHTKQ